jgi:hypothetical protein
MTVTAVSVANSALVKVGADRISALTENVQGARLINTIFEPVRDEVLRAHPWNFAIKRALLAPTSTTPTFEYDYEYDLPADVLRVLTIAENIDDDGTDDLKWDVEGRNLLCDISAVYIKYIKRAEDWSEWDNVFAEAMAWRLAWGVAYALTQSSSVVKLMETGYKAAIAQARSFDGMEGSVKILIADTWIDSRK